jgi:putative NADH-flavin reductase
MQIAVYGASGYLGKLVLAELAHRNIDMLLVGGNAMRLREAARTVGVVNAEQRVADTDDHDALVAAVQPRGAAAVPRLRRRQHHQQQRSRQQLGKQRAQRAARRPRPGRVLGGYQFGGSWLGRGRVVRSRFGERFGLTIR